MLTTSGQRLEHYDIKDFIDVVYAYAINHNGESNLHGREFFIEYIHDLKPDAEKMAKADFKTQTASLMDEMDALRGGLG